MLLDRRRRGMAIGEELCISVPSLFRCPISLDVMRSPVSLSTGVTYDRSSIQKWLDGGNNTCPATMQVLQSKDFVPNLTLHRLIQIWSDSSVPSRDQARELVAELRRDSMMTMNSSAGENLEKIARFAAESDDNRRYLVRLDGFLALMVDLVSNVDLELSEGALRIMATTTSTISRDRESSEMMKDQQLNKQLMLLLRDDHRLTPLLLRVLENSSLSSDDSKIAAVQVIEMVANDTESKLIVSEYEGLLPQLLRIVNQGTGTESSHLMEAILSCLISLSMVKRVKVKLIRLGLVAVLSKQLNGSSSSTTSTTEKMLKLLETVSSCKEGRTEICEDPDCVAAVLGKSMKVSKTATEHAVTILWSVCYLFRDQKAQDAVARNNGLTKILLVMQSNSPAVVRQMAGELLKIFRVNSKSCLSSYDTKTSHIMPF